MQVFSAHRESAPYVSAGQLLEKKGNLLGKLERFDAADRLNLGRATNQMLKQDLLCEGGLDPTESNADLNG
jgi:hypothetical protein